MTKERPSATAQATAGASTLISLSGESGWRLLPEDILLGEIVLRLPLKPLFKLKCISKRYESILSDQVFAKKYRQQQNMKAFLVFPASTDSYVFPKNVTCVTYERLSHDDDESSVSVGYCACRPNGGGPDLILASSNGLVLSNGCGTDLYVSNPLTKQWVRIPEPTLEQQYHYDLVYCIATRWESYKIVLVQRIANGVQLGDNAETTVETFCSVTGQWCARKGIRAPGEVFERSAGRAVFSHKGVLHWLARQGAGMLITYDPYDSPDRFACIPVPQRRYPHLGYTSLIYSGDREMVKYCEMDKGGSVDRLTVWHLSLDKSKKSEWCMEGEFCFPSLPRPCRRLMVGLNADFPDVICHPYVIDCKVMAVNLRNRTWQLVDVLDPDELPIMYSLRACYICRPFIRVELWPWSSPLYKLP